MYLSRHIVSSSSSSSLSSSRSRLSLSIINFLILLKLNVKELLQFNVILLSYKFHACVLPVYERHTRKISGFLTQTIQYNYRNRSSRVRPSYRPENFPYVVRTRSVRQYLHTCTNRYRNIITFHLSRLARIGSPESGFEKGRNTNLQK